MEKPPEEPPANKRTSVRALPPLERIEIPSNSEAQDDPPVLMRKESKSAGLGGSKIEREDTIESKEKKKEKDPMKLADGEKEVNIKGIASLPSINNLLNFYL